MAAPILNDRQALFSSFTEKMPKFMRYLFSDNEKNRVWQNKLAIALLVAVFLSGVATYGALSEAPPFGNDPDTVIWLLNLDLILVLMIVGLIARRIVSVWSGRKRGLAGSHLHVRLVYIFSILAAVPAIIMTVFSAFFFHFGVQTWFSERVQTAVYESQEVAQAYLEEHTQVIRADTLAMENDLNRQADLFMENDKAFDRILQTQSMLRNLSEAIVFDSYGRVYARSGLTFSLEFEDLPSNAMDRARMGEAVVMTSSNDDRVRALVKLDNFIDAYLYVGRMIDPRVLSHLDATKRASQDYMALEDRYGDMQVTVTLIFVVVGLLLLFTAIWFGLLLARQLAQPISELIDTADRVRSGDFSARVAEKASLEEFAYLAQSFNRMTTQIQQQQSDLIDANRQLDQRRQFTESVLTGVSSGVIAISSEGEITVVNSSACDLLDKNKDDIVGHKISTLMPEICELLERAYERVGKTTQSEIHISQGSKKGRVYLVRTTIEKGTLDKDNGSAILTFDDITDLQSAQRKAAWADVARRIAHEIKNPLTPIQLSAERLKRRYLKQITDDPETFMKCTDTIIRHVGDIGHMVNEFSAFARLPEPVLTLGDLNLHIIEALELQRQAHPDIDIRFNKDRKQHYKAVFDPQQIRQVIGNLTQNAIDSINEHSDESLAGAVQISIGECHDDSPMIYISISDNGFGFPEGVELSRLTEPYVTHKSKGTGLGLAIVKKIMDDHNGRIYIGAPEWLASKDDVDLLSGATIVLTLPLDKHIEA